MDSLTARHTRQLTHRYLICVGTRTTTNPLDLVAIASRPTHRGAAIIANRRSLGGRFPTYVIDRDQPGSYRVINDPSITEAR